MSKSSSKSSKRRSAARADTIAPPAETDVDVEVEVDVAEDDSEPEPVKPDPEPAPPVAEKPREARPRPQMRQPTPAQEVASAKAPGKRQWFRVDKPHRTIGPRGVMTLAAGSLVTSATHDLVQLAEEGAILSKV